MVHSAKKLLAISLCLCLVLASGALAAPALAAEEYQLSGAWIFNFTLSFPSEEFDYPVSFSCDGVLYTSMNFIPAAMLKFRGPSGARIAVNGSAWFTSRTLDFGAEPQTVSADFYTWFTANAVPAPSVTVRIDGKAYSFSNTPDATLPVVTMTVSPQSGTATLTDGVTQHTVQLPEDFAEFSAGSAVYPAGTYLLGGADGDAAYEFNSVVRFTVLSLVKRVGQMFTGALSWVSTVSASITSNAYLLLFGLLSLVGLGVGLFARFRKSA